MDHPLFEQPLELRADRLAECINFPAEGLRLCLQSVRLGRCEALELGCLSDNRGMAHLDDFVLGESATLQFGELLDVLHLFVEVDQDPEFPEAAPTPGLDGAVTICSIASLASSPLVLTAAASLVTRASPSALSRLKSAMIAFWTAPSASAIVKPIRLTATTTFIAASALSPCRAASALVTTSIRSVLVACRAASMVHSFTHSRACLIESASGDPAVAPFTMLAVRPSIPAEAPCAAFDADCSMLDKPALTVLI